MRDTSPKTTSSTGKMMINHDTPSVWRVFPQLSKVSSKTICENGNFTWYVQTHGGFQSWGCPPTVLEPRLAPLAISAASQCRSLSGGRWDFPSAVIASGIKKPVKWDKPRDRIRINYPHLGFINDDYIEYIYIYIINNVYIYICIYIYILIRVHDWDDLDMIWYDGKFQTLSR